MENCYEVYLGDRPAGKVQLIVNGLYVRVICRCLVPKDQVYRLYLVCGGHKENIGVVVPESDGFVLDKQIPVKRFGTGKIQFVLSSGTCGMTGEFVPICPEEPFSYIDRLKNAFLETEHGKIGIRTEKRPEAV